MTPVELAMRDLEEASRHHAAALLLGEAALLKKARDRLRKTARAYAVAERRVLQVVERDGGAA